MSNPTTRTINYNAWAEELFVPHGDSPYDFMLMEGGRGSSKTYEVTQALVVKGHISPLRIAVAREHLKSIDKSAKPELEQRIRNLGLLRPDCYRTSKTSIDHANGSHIFFIGLTKLSEEDIKGLALVDLMWIEEAHRMSHSSWELIEPTIRKDGAQILATWNNKYRTDAIAEFLADNKDDSRFFHRRITYRDNAYFTARNERSRIRDKRINPDRYPHIWEGEFDDVADTRKVLPYKMLEICCDAWDKRPVRGAIREAGLDVADTGKDDNSLCIRSGPELYHLTRWPGSVKFTTSDTARRAKRRCDREGVSLLRFDAGGVGAGIRGPLSEEDPQFVTSGQHFNGKVQAPDVVFMRGRIPVTNAMYFANWAAQAGWAVRLRAERTLRLVNGEDVDPHDCLFINPDIPKLLDIMAQWAQPEWDDSKGKLRIQKQPRAPGEEIPDSPDAYDAMILAYSSDARRGLRQG